VGSTNQRFLHLSGRLEKVMTPDRLEVTVSTDGSGEVNGWADDETLDALLAGGMLRHGPAGAGRNSAVPRRPATDVY